VTTFVYGVIEQPVLGWGDATVVTSLLVGGSLLLGFVAWELHTPVPLVDLRLFRDPRFSCSTLVSVVMSFALMGVLFVYTPFLQIVQGSDAQATGIRLLPLIGGIVIGALDSHHMVARFGVRLTLVLGLLGCSAGMALMSLVGAASGDGLELVALPMIGIGNAVVTFTALNVILDVLPASQTGAGTALTRTVGQVGASFGVAILGSVLSGAYRAELAGHLTGLPAQVRAMAEGSVAGAAAVAGDLPALLGTPLLSAAQDAYSLGMSDVLRVSAAVMVVASVLIAALMPERERAVGGEHAARQRVPADLQETVQVAAPEAR
jgi:hypothetical protein